MSSAKGIEPECSEEIAAIRNSPLQPAEKIAALITGPGTKCADSAEYNLEMGSYYIALEEYAQARKHFEIVIDEFPSREHEALLGIGNTYLHRGDFARAIDTYQQIVDRFPAWDKGYEYLGTAYVHNENFEAAIEILQRGVSVNSENIQMHRYLGFSHYYMSNPQQAIDSFDKAFALDKELLLDKHLMIAASRSYIELGKYDVAESLLMLLVSNVPEVEKDRDYLLAVKYLMDEQGK